MGKTRHVDRRAHTCGLGTRSNALPQEPCSLCQRNGRRYDQATGAVVLRYVSFGQDLLIRQLVRWRSLGHSYSCGCHVCSPLRDRIDDLYLADRYPLRYGVTIDRDKCRHGRLLSAECPPCTELWERGEERPYPHCFSCPDPRLAGAPLVDRSSSEVKASEGVEHAAAAGKTPSEAGPSPDASRARSAVAQLELMLEEAKQLAFRWSGVKP